MNILLATQPALPIRLNRPQAVDEGAQRRRHSVAPPEAGADQDRVDRCLPSQQPFGLGALHTVVLAAKPVNRDQEP